VTKGILVAQFLRARAWWRLDCAGASAGHMARSVVALLDAAGYARDLRDDDPSLFALDAAGCFKGGFFDPGPDGWAIVRGWQLADQTSAGPEDLLVQLARAATRNGQPPHRDNQPSHRDAQPSHRDTQPPHRDAQPPHRDAQPPHRDGRTAHLTGPVQPAIGIPRQSAPAAERIWNR
jgi:hypothetical protein